MKRSIPIAGKDIHLFPVNYTAIKSSERPRYVNFHKELSKSSVEEDVKAAYRKFFALPQDSSKNHDLYTPQVLFEFKNDRNFANRRVRAEVQAQILYYVHRLKFEPGDKNIPPFLCIADVNETVVTETILWESFYNNPSYDWTAAPSSPDTKLINDLQASEAVGNMRVFHPFDLNELQFLDDFFHRIYTNAIDQSLIVKKDITERNFEDIYHSWYAKFAEDVRNGYKPSQYFICDIQEGKSYVRQDNSRVYFDIEEGKSIPKKLNLKDYLAFWSLYNKNRTGNVDVIRGILSKADRLSEESQRRFEGEFYTPIHLARKAIDYLDTVVGGDVKQIDWESGQYRLWDMACGTGNLEYHLPAKAYRYCYMSTLHQEDVVFCKGMFHDSKVFQYDYLNDDIDRVLWQDNTRGWKMPQELVSDLENPDLKWIIFINPPFGTAQNKSKADESKRDISMTKVRDHMTLNKLGEASRELFTQFLYRIHHEFKNKQAWLGLFSKLKYINANNDQRFREAYFRYKFEKGFIFDARVFDSVKGEYPIGFLIWNLKKLLSDFSSQSIIVEKCDKKGEALESKTLNVINKKLLLNKWVERLRTTTSLPAFSSALTIIQERKDLRDRVSPGFLCSLCAKGNDLQNQKYVSIYSGPYCSAGAFSVTKDSFLKAMIIHAVRKIAKKDWSNDRDQFCKPYIEKFHNEVIREIGYVEGITPEFPMDFARDCVVWSLFANSNHTVALKDVEYKGKTYQIHNNLFPFTIEQVKQWGIQDQDIAITITAEDEDRFAAKWLMENQSLLSQAATNVVDAARDVYRIYFTNLNSINTNRYKIKTWGVGRYQIINSMKDVEIGLNEIKSLDEEMIKLAERIRLQIHPLGFLR